MLLSIILAAGMLIGYGIQDTSDFELIKVHENEEKLRPTHIDNVMRLIESNYLFEPDYDEMTNKALNSISQSLDPFSAYIEPSEFYHVRDNLNASYTGMGIYSQDFKDSLVIIEILKNSPAQKAGLKTLEKILKINGKNLVGWNNDQITQEFLKNKGKKLDLLISGRDFKKRIVSLKIDSVETQTVNRIFNFGNSTLYVGLSQFSNHTYRELLGIIEKNAQNKKIKNLIIDVRDNPGGYLQEVVKILDQLFSQSGLTLVETVYKDGRKDVLKTSGRNFYDIEKVTVIINEFSASGSEVLAGSLQDHDRALIIGKNSFGKGLVQDQYDLFNGGALRLTVANYFLPSGRSIQKDIKFPKTIKKDQFYTGQDTFFSLIKRRPLYSGRGIEPDIIVNDSLFSKSLSLVENTSYKLYPVLIDYIFRNKVIMNSGKNDLKNDYNFLNDKVVSAFLEQYQLPDNRILTEIVKSKIAYLINGRALETEILLKSDPFVQRALFSEINPKKDNKISSKLSSNKNKASKTEGIK